MIYNADYFLKNNFLNNIIDLSMVAVFRRLIKPIFYFRPDWTPFRKRLNCAHIHGKKALITKSS